MNFRHFTAGLAISAAALCSGIANAGIINWNISGPGVTGINQVGDVTDATYNVGGYGSYNTWTVSGIASQAGDYTFDWNYSGHHSWYQASALLNAFDADGSTSLFPWSPVSGGFNLSGSYTFDNVAAGETIGFTFSGYHYDASQLMVGTLHLEQIPEPSALMLASLGLVGLAATRRRKQ